MNFCKTCDNILIKKKNEREYMNYCILCDEFFPLTNNILFQKTNLTTDKKLQIQVQMALYDNTYPRIKGKCPNCSATILKYFVNKETLKNIYVCESCKKYWV